MTDCTSQITPLYADAFGASRPELLNHSGGVVPPPAPCAIPDNEIVKQIRESRQADKFDRLWSGDTRDYSGDHSAADLALCSMLAWWCDGDQRKVDTLFRQSGLMRRKWNRDDYRQRTLDMAVAQCGRRTPAADATELDAVDDPDFWRAWAETILPPPKMLMFHQKM